MKRLWREPLLPFAIIAGFLLWLQPTAHDNDLVIELSPEISSNLEADFKRQRRRPPTPSEVTELEETWVEMEILSREARQLGLDRNDPVVRRRLAQAMRFYLENGLPPAPPSEAEINAYIEANRDDLSLPRRRRFAHLFFSHQSRQAKAKEDAESALKILKKIKIRPKPLKVMSLFMARSAPSMKRGWRSDSVIPLQKLCSASLKVPDGKALWNLTSAFT